MEISIKFKGGPTCQNPLKRGDSTGSYIGFFRLYHAVTALRDTIVIGKSQICKDSILESFHVDDYVDGAASGDDILKLQKVVTSTTLASVGLQIRKWASCSKAVMVVILRELREKIFLYEVDQNLKTLGPL